MFDEHILAHTEPPNNSTQANSSTPSGSTVEVQKKVIWGNWGVVKVVEAVEKIDGGCSDASDYKSKDNPLPSQETSTILEIPSFDDFTAFLESENNSTPVTPALPSWGHWAVVPVTTIDEPFDEDDYHSGDPYSYETQQQSISQVSQSATNTEATTAAKDDCHPATIHTAAGVQKAVGSGSEDGNGQNWNGTGLPRQSSGILSEHVKPRRDYAAGFVEAQGRPGFAIEILNQFSEYSTDLQAHGFTVAKNTAGRFFLSTSGTCAIARLTKPRPNPTGKGYQKYLQSEGKGERFFKLFMANPNDTSVVLVEGVYKAMAAYVCGFNAIAYSGVLGAFQGNEIHPGLLQLITAGFEKVIIGYDIDKSFFSQLYIEHHVLLLKRNLKKREILCNVVQTWDRSLGKDFDEILVNHGFEKLTKILQNTVDSFDWKGISAINSYTATHSESSVYVSQTLISDLIQTYKVLFIKSPMGSGKTYGLAAIFKALHNIEGLIISPLRALGRQITKDLRSQGIDIHYRDDVDASENWERIVCCLESVSTKGKLKIKHDGTQLVDKILVVDEVVVVISNLLEGSTISKTRTEVVELLTTMLRNAKKCVCMSADLTDFHCDVVLKLLGDSVTETEICKYENTLPRNKFHGTFIGSVREGVSFALHALSQGKRVFLGIDSQKTTSTYGTGNLAELFEKGGELFDLKDIPKERILIIDSATSTTKDHEAYEIIAKGNKALLKDKSLIIVSPSVEAGFNLKPEEYSPDLAIICHMGCTTPNGITQFSMRIRNLEVPRFFCFGGQVYNSLTCDGAITKSSAKKYIADQINLIEKATNAKTKDKLIKGSAVNDVLNLSLKLNLDELSLETEFYQLQAIKNLQMLNREFVVATALRAQGAYIDYMIWEDTVAFKDSLLEIKERRIEEEATREFQAPNLSDKEVETLKEAPALSQEQKDSMSKFYAQKAYKYTDVSVEELVDKKNGLLEPEELGFLAFEGNEFNEFLEQERILKLQEVPLYNCTKLLENDKYTNIYKQDIVRGAKSHKVFLAESLGFKEAVEFANTYGISTLFTQDIPGYEQPHPKPILDFVKNLKANKSEWCLTYGWDRIHCLASPIAVFSHALEEFGLKFAGKDKLKVKHILTGEFTKSGREKYRHKYIKLYKSIAPIRSQKSHDKRITALYDDAKARYEQFLETQLMVTVGRRLMVDEPISSQLLNEFGKDLLCEAAKRLPSAEFGLSKHSAIQMEINGFKPNVDVPIVVVSPDNIDEFKTVLDHWFKFQTEIGFDTETYESAIHKLCRDLKNHDLKNNKWYWLNPQTNKRQQIKPGLDQNHNQVRLMQFSDSIQTYVLDFGRCDAPAIPLWLKDAWRKIIKLGEHNTFVGHNLKFDTSSVRKYGLIIKRPYCTMLTSMLLFGDCGAGKVLPNGNGLKAFAHNFLNLPVDKTEQSSDWGAEVLTKSQINYAAKDAVLALTGKKLLDQMLENPAQWGLKEFAGSNEKHANLPLVELENKNIYHTTEMQWRGVPVDVQKLRDRIKKLEALRVEVESDWQALKMPCTPQQAKKIGDEMNRRYVERQHPFDPQEMAEALGVDLEDNTLELPVVDKPFTSTAKDAINDNEDIPEFQVLKAWRAYNTAVTQLSKVLLSAEINYGVCRTEYKPLSGTGRMSCGNEYGLGTPNLQAFVKKAEGKFYGFFRNPDGSPKKFWSKPSVEESVKIRDVFALTDTSKAFFTEDASASHFRLAAGFGQCEFSKSVLADDNMDAHSMFAMMALQAMLTEDTTILDGFPLIRDFVKNLSQDKIRQASTCKEFKKLDKKVSDERFRNAAKTLFYSVLNGAQADKMRKVLSGAVGRSVSVQAGIAMFDSFWQLYKGIGDYIKRILAEAEANAINFNGREFNITTLPDGTKLLYARKDGELATTNIIACQWSRCEATALKKIMASTEEIPKEYGAVLINMVHDEVGVTCNNEHWRDAYRFVSDQFAKEYDMYLQGFIPGDQPTEVKLHEKTHLYIPVVVLNDASQPVLDDKGELKITNLQPTTVNYSVKVGNLITSTQVNKKGEVTTKEVVIACERFGSYWTLPDKPYIPTSWADK